MKAMAASTYADAIAAVRVASAERAACLILPSIDTLMLSKVLGLPLGLHLSYISISSRMARRLPFPRAASATSVTVGSITASHAATPVPSI